jgi:hypothetical protein
VSLLASPQVWIGLLAVAVAIPTVGAIRSGRMFGRFGVPALLRYGAPQTFWFVVAARGAMVILLALSAAAPDLMLDILNGAND